MQQGYAKISLATFSRTEKDKNFFEKTITDTKKFTKNLLKKNFPQNNAAILLGITIGNTDLMDSKLKEDFKKSGLTHILVVSGSNIAFVILILTVILRYFPLSRYPRYMIIGTFLFSYGSLVGWEAPVVRATIMGSIAFLSLRSGHKIHSVSIVFLVAWIFLLFSPTALIYDASFGLSFMATLGIVIFNPIFVKKIKPMLRSEVLTQIITVTLSATIGSFGMLVYHF